MKRLALLFLLLTLTGCNQMEAATPIISTATDRGLRRPEGEQNEQRVALVIGNGAYDGTHFSALNNPVNDARMLKAELGKRQFDVVYAEDADKRTMEIKLKEFYNKIENGGVGVVFFAGHGVEFGGQNFLIPVDATTQNKANIDIDAIALGTITKKMQYAGNRLNIVLLDACRNDPWVRGRGDVGGLAKEDPPRGTLIAYATEANRVAADGKRGENGLFTGHFVQFMKQEGLELRDVLQKTRAAVYRDSNTQQLPSVYDQIIEGEFYFTPAKVAEQTVTQSKPVQSKQMPTEPTRYALKIRPVPSDAVVAVEGVDFYHEGLRFKPGRYAFSVAREGYVTKKRTVVVQRDTKLSVTLEAATKDQSRNDHGTYIEPAMAYINPGSFQMGSNDGDSDEKPVHTVTIQKGFYLGKTEVTIKEYNRCVDDGGCKPPKWLESGSSYNIHTGSDDYYKKKCLKEDCPAIGVSWHNANSYTQWLSRKTGKTYRLPSEAEWEYAARAETTTKWSFGDSDSRIGEYAWYTSNAGSTTHKVGLKKPNPWGLDDMHGNVWEWCADWYTDSYSTTPRDGSENKNGNQNSRVLRGGSWSVNPSVLRSAVRGRFWPSDRDGSGGFRLARD